MVKAKKDNQKEEITLTDLFEIARTLSSTLDLDELLRRIGQAAELLTKSVASSIMLLDDSKEKLYFKTATGEKSYTLTKVEIPIGEGIAGWVAKNKKSLIVDDVKKDKRFTGKVDTTSGFETKSIMCVPMLLGDELIGVAEVLNKSDSYGTNFNDGDLNALTSLAGLASIAIGNAKLANDQKNFFVNMVEILISAIESKDPVMSGHSFITAQLATAIGRELEIVGEDYKNLYYGALIHDVGLISLKTNVFIELPLSDIKFQEKSHPLIGVDMIKGINILQGVVPTVRSHHENYDGTGFPDGLKGDGIPLGARIIGLVEAVEEMRISGFDHERIIHNIKINSSRFDPKILEIFLAVYEFTLEKV